MQSSKNRTVLPRNEDESYQQDMKARKARRQVRTETSISYIPLIKQTATTPTTRVTRRQQHQAIQAFNQDHTTHNHPRYKTRHTTQPNTSRAKQKHKKPNPLNISGKMSSTEEAGRMKKRRN